MLGGNAALRRLIDEAHAPGDPGRARRRLQPRQPRVLPVPRHPRERGRLGLPRLVHGPQLPALRLRHATRLPATRPGGTCPPCRSSTPTPRRSANSSGGSAASGSTSASTAGGSTWPTRSTTTRFWQEFRRRVRAGNPDAYIVGEVWTEASRWLQGDMWDAVMNYLFTRACIAFFIGEAVDRERARAGRASGRSTRPAPRRSARRSRR